MHTQRVAAESRGGAGRLVLALALLAGCTSALPGVDRGATGLPDIANSTVDRTPTPPSATSDSPTGSTPIFNVPTALAACAADGVVGGTSRTHWKPLVGCNSEAAGTAPAPLITVDVGQSAYVSAPAVPGMTLATTATDIVTIRGLEIIGVHRGKATITATDVYCDGHLPDPADPCILLSVYVSERGR